MTRELQGEPTTPELVNDFTCLRLTMTTQHGVRVGILSTTAPGIYHVYVERTTGLSEEVEVSLCLSGAREALKALVGAFAGAETVKATAGPALKGDELEAAIAGLPEAAGAARQALLLMTYPPRPLDGLIQSARGAL